MEYKSHLAVNKWEERVEKTSMGVKEYFNKTADIFLPGMLFYQYDQRQRASEKDLSGFLILSNKMNTLTKHTSS